jgi:hypothetical protein
MTEDIQRWVGYWPSMINSGLDLAINQFALHIAFLYRASNRSRHSATGRWVGGLDETGRNRATQHWKQVRKYWHDMHNVENSNTVGAISTYLLHTKHTKRSAIFSTTTGASLSRYRYKLTASVTVRFVPKLECLKKFQYQISRKLFQPFFICCKWRERSGDVHFNCEYSLHLLSFCTQVYFPS